MKAEERSDAVLLHPAGPARSAVVWLHGLGADGYDFAPLVPELELPPELGVRFIFPHAPVRPVTLNNRMPMRAWYDIITLSRDGIQDEAGIRDSERLVHGFIKTEIDGGIPASRIVIAGFSQGGAITLHTGLRYPQRLAGLLPLSTYLPLQNHLAAEVSAANRDVPMLMCHGTYDPVLQYKYGESSRQLLQSMGYTVDWREYPMQHQVCPEEIADISQWLQKVLA